MYLEQRVEKLETLVDTLQEELKAFRAVSQDFDSTGLPETAAPIETPKAEEPKAEEPKAEEPKAEEPKAEEPKAEEPKAEEPKAEEPKAEEATRIYTLDDVRAKVTEVMKADKSKKGALHALLKTHGADRVSELNESKFVAVIDAIEKGDF